MGESGEEEGTSPNGDPGTSYRPGELAGEGEVLPVSKDFWKKI